MNFQTLTALTEVPRHFNRTGSGFRFEGKVPEPQDWRPTLSLGVGITAVRAGCSRPSQGFDLKGLVPRGLILSPLMAGFFQRSPIR